MTKTITAAVVNQPHGRFTLEPVVLDDLRSDEILIRNQASGICHTDTIAQDIVKLPAVLGHEGAGIVEAVGSAVSRFSKGDRVIVSYPSCGGCRHCVEGHPYFCDHHMPLAFAGSRLDGSSTMRRHTGSISGAFFQQSSFASHSITAARNVVAVGDDAGPADLLAAIPCGVQTGAGSVLNTFKVGAKESLAVFGTGTVGMSAVMAGRLVGASPLVAIDVNPQRLELALELGATHVLNAKDSDITTGIREIVPNGIDYALETSGNEQALNDAIACLRTGGCCGMVISPHFGKKYMFSPTEVFKRAANLCGIIQGSAIPATFLPKILELNRQGRFPYQRLVKTYRFDDINMAFEDAHAGRTIKPVLIFE